MKKKIALLGSTGSIGRQTLDVVAQQKEKFEISVLTANQNIDLLTQQAIDFQPSTVIIADDSLYSRLKNRLSNFPNIKVRAGLKSLADIVKSPEIDIVLTAMVGFAGLKPTLNAIEAGKTIALANKETLVVAGDLISKKAKERNVAILPVDSEHSAIFQCLVGEEKSSVEKIILTASGGPFRKKLFEELKFVTKNEALNHPNWAMGNKITIDSATLMNKGLEVIEAKWLFDLQLHQISVVVHPQSIIHSLVQFCDSSIKAQMGFPDMRLPILYALSFPKRLKTNFLRFDFSNFSSLTFEKPDTKKFRCLEIAYECLKNGGNSACVMNAANEIAVQNFLQEKISFLEIPEIIEHTLLHVSFVQHPDLFDYQESDQIARQIASERIKQLLR